MLHFNTPRVINRGVPANILVNNSNDQKIFIEQMFDNIADIPIENIIGKRISLIPKGQHLLGLCPFHADTKIGSFVVTPKKQMWKCFTCGAEYGGNAIKFVALLDNKKYIEAALQIALEESLISYTDFDNFHSYEISPSMEKKLSINKLPKKNPKASIANMNLVYQAMKDLSSLSNKHYELLLNKRKLTEDRIKKDYFTFPNVNEKNLIKKLLKLFSVELLMTIPGFYWDKLENRLSCACYKGIGILIRDENGNIEGVQIRKDTNKPGYSRYVWFSSSFAQNNQKKYIGGLESGSPRDVLISENSKSILCITEGRFKAEKLAEFNNVVISIQGVSTWRGINYNIKEIIKKHPINIIYIMFDSDMLGNTEIFKQSVKLIDDLHRIFPNIVIKYALWRIEFGKGIDDLILNEKLSYITYWTPAAVNSLFYSTLEVILDAYDVACERDIPKDKIDQFKSDLQITVQEILQLPSLTASRAIG